jgi:uncharacterized RDD family membrane protein YckC
MPSRRWYLVGLLVAVLGLGGAALYLFSRLAAIDDGVTRMVVPGETMMTLQPGTYTVFHEYSSLVDGRYYEAHDIAGLCVTVADPAGTPIALRNAIIRNLFRFIDGLPFYLIGFLVMCFSGRRQRLGDIVAGTIAVRHR